MKHGTPMPPSARIFAPDEVISRRVSPSWNLADLLKQEGIFFLKDLASLLNMHSTKVNLAAQNIHRRKRSAWEDTGVKRIWGRRLWLVQMAVFSAYFQFRSARPRRLTQLSRFGPFCRKN